MNVLVVPEDSRKDQYILKPLFERFFRLAGKSRAAVRICQDPVLGGVREALKSSRLKEIVESYRGMTDMFILCVDRDGDEGRRRRLDQLEDEFGSEQVFFAENAWEELEAWVLAGLDLPADWRWEDVRGAVDVKERYFDVLARRRGVAGGVGGGRKALGEQAARRIPAIRSKCPEDFGRLARRVEAAAQSGA